ncbi:E3 ubiquitin-protein ligase WAV3-like [Senna tora]|uniref:E3 ubiquitin-protein ligase WAV3-like n=1 Tax=Senna tora TaxID=362788 RepID=A0A834T753_9FABA|nr:E3 ubiquitin-protein ligase WAV3-like [Senna tora]
MGTGWRRAFCTRDPESRISDKQQKSPSPSSSPSPRSCARLGFLSGSSPKSQSKNAPKAIKSPKTPSTSNPTSPRSPLKLSLFRNSFKFRSSCGLCLNSVKTGQGTAIYTAECSHAFHFPCIAAHVSKHGSLVCPVCNATWKDIPLLALHKTQSSQQNDMKHSDSTRSYDDDEPLLSPTSGGRIIPIPEADESLEEDDEVVEEFQGFFVNPKPPDHHLQLQAKEKENSRNVEAKLVGECAVISISRSHQSWALVLKVKAPPRNSNDPSQRAPIDLVTLLDVSGSMTGAKLHMLKRAMRLVICSLGPADRLSIVAFSSVAKRLLPLRRMSPQGQRVARRIVDRLVCGQGTCVADALRKANKVLEDRRERNPVASVMLLSDGQDERVQPTNQPKCSTHVSSTSTRFAHIEIPVHAFGFGHRAHYSQSQEPAEDAFAKCVGGLLSVVVQDLRIQLGFQSGSAPAEISAVYSCSGRPTALVSSGSVRLGDLYAEEQRELLLEVRIPASALGSHSHHVMSVRCVYKDPATQEIVYGREEGLVVPPAQSARGSGARIERLRNLFVTTRAIAESRRLVEHNDFTTAHHLLASARALLMQSSSISADEFIRGLEAELADLHWRRRRRGSERESSLVDEDGEPLTPTSAWRAAEKLAKMAMMKKSLNRVGDLHGFENARF